MGKCSFDLNITISQTTAVFIQQWLANVKENVKLLKFALDKLQVDQLPYPVKIKTEL